MLSSDPRRPGIMRRSVSKIVDWKRNCSMLHIRAFHWSVNGLLNRKSSGLEFHSIVYLLRAGKSSISIINVRFYNQHNATHIAHTHIAHAHCVPNRISMRVTCFTQFESYDSVMAVPTQDVRRKTQEAKNKIRWQDTREIWFQIIPQAMSAVKMHNHAKIRPTNAFLWYFFSVFKSLWTGNGMRTNTS